MPTQIIIKAGKRAWKRLRKEIRGAAQLIRDAMPDRHTPERLVSKIVKHFKTWQLNTDEDGMVFLDCGENTTVWHRDLVAAKCILYKGE